MWRIYWLHTSSVTGPTPVARVIFSLFAFLYQKDWKYVVFTAIVLALLLYSLLGSAGA